MKRLISLLMCLCIVSLSLLFCACSIKVTEITAQTEMTEDSEMTVSFIDVGKGDTVLVRKGGSTVLIDTGYSGTSNRIISYLDNYGISGIDCLIITHYDKDHAGGASDIIERYDIGSVYLPSYEGENKAYSSMIESLQKKDISPVLAEEDITFSYADITFNIFASDVVYEGPTDDKEGNDNDVSLVISAVYKDDSYLFAGDIEKDGINAYLAENHGHYDVLKMPHHGQKSKNTDDLVSDVSPEIAVITDSIDESADEKVLELLYENDITVYNTSVYGTIVLKSDGTGNYKFESSKEG